MRKPSKLYWSNCDTVFLLLHNYDQTPKNIRSFPFILTLIDTCIELGDAAADANLGFMYLYGVGVPENHSLALHYFNKSAQSVRFYRERRIDSSLRCAQVTIYDLLLKCS